MSGKKVPVGQDVLSERAGWRFDEAVASRFDEHVRRSVPLYDEVQRMVAELSDFHVADGTGIYDYGTATGEVLNNVFLRHPKKKNLRFVGVDNSEAMLRLARRKLCIVPNLTLIEGDVEEVEPVEASFVTCLYTLQFVPPHLRAGVVKKAYDGLLDNGAFILVEKMEMPNSRFNAVFIELYHELKLRNGLSEKEVVGKALSLRGVLNTFSLEKNRKLLLDAGFGTVDTFFQWYNFIGLVGVK